MKKTINKIIYIFISVIISINTVFAAEFKDIPHGFWAYREVHAMADAKIINLESNDYFYPDLNITRAEFCKMIVKALEKEEMQVDSIYSFEDLNNTDADWKYVNIAVNLDIIKPTEDNYIYPNEFVSRTEMIDFLVNLLKTDDITKQEALAALKKAYLDYDDVPDWFKPIAGRAEVIDVIAKEPPKADYLNADGYVDRAQAAVFMYKMKREIDSYLEEKIKEETAPKTVDDGLVIERTYQYQDIVTLPSQTVLPVVVLGQLSSKTSELGDIFQAKFANNIIDDENHLLLSKDVVLIGKVLDTTKAKRFRKNGMIMFEFDAANHENILSRIFAMAECEAINIEANKIKKAAKTILKGRDFVVKDGQIIYIKLYEPIRVNIVTGEILN